MIRAFAEGKDIYATIASIAFGVSYEDCLEFHPETHEYQKEGKERRSSAKLIVLGISYGRSVNTIADQLFGKDDSLSDDEKVKKAQHVYDSVMNAFPNLRQLMITSQKTASEKGYVETILGRRRHIPEMMLPPFEFKPLPGYVNPDIDPLDPATLQNKEQIPSRVVKALQKEYAGFKYNGQRYKRNKELHEEHIKVIDNRSRISDASRECVNCVDYETEILTQSGWKSYNEVAIGDKILSYSLDKQQIVEDVVEAVHIYDEPQEVVKFESSTFSAVSTMNHRWVVGESDKVPKITTTANICQHKWTGQILRIADNSIESRCNLSDAELKVLGWYFTDGNRTPFQYGIHLYQSTRKEKNAQVYQDMISSLSRVGVECTDYSKDGAYHEIYLKKNVFTSWMWSTFSDRCPTFEFVSSLSQHQATVLMRAMLQGDGSGVDGQGVATGNESSSLFCRSAQLKDAFQYLCVRAGFATNAAIFGTSKANTKQYNTCVLKVKRAHVYPEHKTLEIVDGVWCVTTKEGTWIARRSGKVYITGNSRVQGSASELTKMAILRLIKDPRWASFGGRLLVPVHDELIAEVPLEYAEEAGKVLIECMCEAGNFLPFTISCDLETSIRWYGLGVDSLTKHEKPHSFDNLTEDNIKWIQCYLCEMEYVLPIFLEEDGSKPRGDGARGVSGKWSEAMDTSIADYCKRYHVSREAFFDDIHQRAMSGYVHRNK